MHSGMFANSEDYGGLSGPLFFFLGCGAALEKGEFQLIGYFIYRPTSVLQVEDQGYTGTNKPSKGWSLVYKKLATFKLH